MARAEVIMPQMGESITEGTVVQWLKQVGDALERDENLLEISTDKVDAEIPSPVSGTLVEILVQPGQTVAVGTTIAWVETAASATLAAGERLASAGVPETAAPAVAPAPPAAGVTDVIMPQMGESITEGTVVQWLKQVGDALERDENLLEISTDKVDAEIPSPVSGTLVEILVQPGQTVAVGTTIARVSGGEGAAVAGPLPVASAAAPPPTAAAAPAVAVAPAAHPGANGSGHGFRPFGAGPGDDLETLRRLRSSPLVRRIAREHDVDLAAVPGTGLSGRVTKDDIVAFVEARKHAARPAPAAQPQGAPAPTAVPVPGAPPRGAIETSAPLVAQAPPRVPIETSAPFVAQAPPRVPIYEGDRVETMSAMRMSIAKHMVQSRQTSPHAHTVHEVDFAATLAAKKRLGPQYEARGVRLTMTAFIARACISALERYPIVNSSVSGNQIIYRQSINLGVAVALEDGLIVPVIRHAEDLNLMGLSRAINDLAERARNKKLKPDEVSGGTFTVTNPGIFGSLFGIPIINQPQVAILGCGAIKKNLVVNDDDTFGIRPQSVFCLSFDHRVVDGAIADHFMVAIKDALANPPAA